MAETEQTPAIAPIPLIIAVCGHRPNKLGGYIIPNPLYDLTIKGLVEAFDKFKPSYVITGMAIGVDQWAAEICINLKIPFVAAIPFSGQESKWPNNAQVKYHWLLNQAFNKYTISEGGYSPSKMQKRNEWMVKSCHQVVAVWDGSPGGTMNCLGAAAQLGKPIHYVPIPPAGMAVGEFFEKNYGVQPQAKPVALDVPGTKRIVEV